MKTKNKKQIIFYLITLLSFTILMFSCQSKTAYYYNGDEVEAGGQIDLSGARWYHFGSKAYSVDDLNRFSTLREINMRLPKGEKLKKIGLYHYASKRKVIFVSAKAHLKYHTYFTRDYGHSVHIFQIKDADTPNFKVYKNNPIYARDQKHVYYLHTILDDADPDSFRVFKESKLLYYGVDKNHVYIADKRIGSSDGASFRFLNELYAKDNNHVYYVEHYSNSGPATVVDGTDAASFEVIDLGKYGIDKYARDKISAYFVGKKIAGSHGSTFEVLELKDTVRETIGSGLYSRDQMYAYWNAEQLADLDIKSFSQLSNRYAKDNNTVYFMKKEVVGADAGSFRLLGNDCARDKSKLWFKDSPATKSECKRFR